MCPAENFKKNLLLVTSILKLEDLILKFGSLGQASQLLRGGQREKAQGQELLATQEAHKLEVKSGTVSKILYQKQNTKIKGLRVWFKWYLGPT
jgi:hypothetical protein